jgi:hypothetical protein
MKRTASILAFSFALIGGLAAIAASATPISLVTVTNMQFPSPTTVTIHSQVGGVNERVYAGAFATTASDTVGSFESWCVDIFQATTFNDHVKDYHRETGVFALGATKTSLLERLATESLGLVKDATTSAAFQLAMWEIVNETNARFDLTRGKFRATGASDNSIALANSWLKNLPGANTVPTYDLSVLMSPTHQDLGTFTRVPEPSTIAVMFAGLIGFVMAGRRKMAKR